MSTSPPKPRDEQDEHDDEDRAFEPDDRSANQLDDVRDRQELRNRHYGLLQELRVLLPGTQVLVAFLLTVPFNDRFAELDTLEHRLYAVALGTGVLAIVSLIAPTAFHRLGPRRSRAARLVWSIRLLRIGLGFLGVSLIASLAVVTRLVFGDVATIVVGIATTAIVLLLWVALPLLVVPSARGED